MIKLSNAFIYLAILSTYLFWLFKFPFTEDELDLIRYGYLLNKGFVPGIDFIDLTFPLFPKILSFLISFCNQSSNIIIKLRAVFMLINTIGVFYLYRTIKLIRNEQLAKFVVLATIVSHMFFLSNITISSASLSIPLLFIIMYYVVKFYKCDVIYTTLISFFITLLLMIDQRLSVLFGIILIYFYYKKTIKIHFFLIIPILFLLTTNLIYYFINPDLPKFFFNVSKHLPYKFDQSPAYFINYLLSDICFVTLCLICLITNFKNNIKILFVILVYSLIAFVFFAPWRPHTFLKYILPFAAFFMLENNFKNKQVMIFLKMNKYLLEAGILLIFLLNTFLFNPPWLKDHEFTLNKQCEYINKIKVYENNGSLTLNLSRFTLNIFNNISFPLLRLEEDSRFARKQMGVDSYFFNSLLDYIIYFKPRYIIYSEDDSNISSLITKIINEKYVKIEHYLYQLIETENSSDIDINKLNRYNKQFTKEFFKKAANVD